MSEIARQSHGNRGQIARGLGQSHSQVRPYSRMLDRGAIGSLGQLDGRSAQGRLVRHLEAELVAHVGGNPTIAQRLLIERIIKMKWQLDLLDEKLEKGEWTAHDTRTYGGLSNAYRLAIRELGIKPQEVRPLSLDEVVTAFKKPA